LKPDRRLRQTAERELHPRARGRHLLHRAAKAAHFDQQRRERVDIHGDKELKHLVS
jgi:hypothetical protein